jgi:hypothetical protein
MHKLNHTILKGLHQLIILQRNFAHKSAFPIHTSKKSSVEKGHQMGSLPAAEEVSQRKRLFRGGRPQGSRGGLEVRF